MVRRQLGIKPQYGIVAVVEISTERVLYAGPSTHFAAKFLQIGTHFAWAINTALAQQLCVEQVQLMKRGKWTPRPLEYAEVVR